MTIKTKTLALHSIQKNMLGTALHDNQLHVLLNTGKVLVITAVTDEEASSIDNCLNFYPSEGRENNSRDFEHFFTLQVV
jgi:hypothetical protein